MLAPKVWIPILIVLLAVIGGVLFYGQQVATQPATTRFIPVETPQTPKPPPPGETHETGHWHGDHWHAEPHEVAEMPLSSREWQQGDVWYPENYTHADIAADRAGKGASTEEEYHRRAMKNRVNIYLRDHREKYPDCTEHETVLADAIPHAEWVLADQAYVDKDSELTAEYDRIMTLYDNFRKKYDATLFSGKRLSPEETRVAESERQTILKLLDAHDEQAKILKREEPGPIPKPIHTH